MDGGDLHRLLDVVARANQTTTRDGIAKMLVEQGMAVLGVPIAGVWLLSESGDVLDAVSFGGPPTGPWQAVPIDGDSPLATCVRTRTPIWLATPAEYTARFPESRARMTEDVACVCLPLVVNERAIGGAVFASATAIDLSDADKTTLVLVAAQCADALERLRLIDSERAARHDAEALARRMTGLQAVAARLAAARGVDDIARVATEYTVATLGASAASVWVVDGDAIVLAGERGMPERLTSEIARIPLDDPGPLATSIRERRSIWLSSRAAADDVEVVPSRWIGIESGATLPLIAESDLVGGFVVVFAEARAFERSERETVETFAAHCALALDRTRLVDATTKLAGRMSALQAMAARFAAARSFDEIAAIAIAEATSAVVGASTAGLWQIEGRELVLAKHVGSPPEVIETVRRIPLDDRSTLPEAVRTRTTQYVESRGVAKERAQYQEARWAVIEAAVFAPLVAGDRVVGALGLGFQRTRSFDLSEREMIELFASHAAQAIARARDDAAQRLLAEASGSLAASLDASAVLERVGALTVAAFADWCFIDLVEADGTLDRAIVAHADPKEAELAESLRGVGGPVTTMVADAIKSQRPFVVGHVSDDQLTRTQRTEETGRLARALDAQSVMCVPMVVGGRAIGGISWIMRSRAVDDRDVAIAEQIARAAAAALENARLYAAEADSARRLRKLYELTTALSSARTPQEVARVAARLGAEETGGDQSALWMLDADGNLRQIAAHGSPEWIAMWSVLPRDPELPAYRVLATGEAVWVETAAEYEREAPTIYERVRALGHVKPFVALPLVVAGARRAVLTFGYSPPHHFDAEERAFLSAIVTSCEQALERAELYATEAGARAAAEAASRTKDEFLAMLGHELRNPLAPIVTALELLRMRGSSEAARERAIIERQVSHLTRLVDDLLDISRITRGKIELRRKPDEIISAIEPAIEAVAPLLAQHKHELRLDVAPTGLRVDGDRERLSQVVRNLVTNAAKYTPPGGHIEVTARAVGGDVELVVKDDGRGISADLLPRVFEPFVQAAQGVDRSGGGLGLGLAIVKSLVDLHGGSVTIASGDGRPGTCVTVRLPRADAAAKSDSDTAGPARSSRAMRVLVVDDNLDAAVLLGDLLRALGHDPVIAHDGAAALAIAAAATNRPELAILDLGLPGMDGYELAARLTKALVEKPIPVVALTGYGQASDRERSRAAGFSEHLVKPVALQDLHAVVERLGRPGDAGAPIT